MPYQYPPYLVARPAQPTDWLRPQIARARGLVERLLRAQGMIRAHEDCECAEATTNEVCVNPEGLARDVLGALTEACGPSCAWPSVVCVVAHETTHARVSSSWPPPPLALRALR